MANVISFVNQIAGVGKTTVVLQTAAILKKRGYQVLMVDFDPQSALTKSFGIEPAEGFTILELIKGEVKVDDILIRTASGDLLPSDYGLGLNEKNMFDAIGRAFFLSNALSDVVKKYDYVLIDCPPSKTILVYNALLASTYSVIVTDTSKYNVKWLNKQFDIFSEIETAFKKRIKVLGILLTRTADKQRLEKGVSDAITSLATEKKTLVFNTTILNGNVINEASACFRSLPDFAPTHELTKRYESFVDELTKFFEEKKKRKNK